MQFAYRCAPWKVTSRAESLVLRALQFQKIGVCRKFSGGAGVSHCPNESFVEGQFNVGA